MAAKQILSIMHATAYKKILAAAGFYNFIKLER